MAKTYSTIVNRSDKSKHPCFISNFAKSLQSCPTLCDPIDGSPPGYPVPGILQARTLEWVAIAFSNAWKWKVKVKSLSRVRPSAIPWTAAHQAPLSMRFSRQEYWSGLPLTNQLEPQGQGAMDSPYWSASRSLSMVGKDITNLEMRYLEHE